VLWSTIKSTAAFLVIVAKFCGDSDLVANRCEGFSDKLFASIWAVNFSGIKERDAFFVGRPNELNAFGFGCWGAVVGADTSFS
jgi:hypothetical protein